MVDQIIKDRFWTKVDKTADESSCWNWIGHIARAGYGVFIFEKRKWYSHRMSFLLSNGYIDSNLCVCHKCDNRKCVNPNHLFLGTRDDNNKDMVKKGRQAHGEGNGGTIRRKLSKEQVILIRESNHTEAALGKMFGVSTACVHKVRKRKSYAHI